MVLRVRADASRSPIVFHARLNDAVVAFVAPGVSLTNDSRSRGSQSATSSRANTCW